MNTLILLLSTVLAASGNPAWGDEQGLASTTSPEQACSLYQKAAKELEEHPHQMALAAAAGGFVGAGLATLGTQLEASIARKHIENISVRAAERLIAEHLESKALDLAEQTMHLAVSTLKVAAADGARMAETTGKYAFRFGNTTYSSIADVLKSPELSRLMESGSEALSTNTQRLYPPRARVADAVPRSLVKAYLRVIGETPLSSGAIEAIDRACLARGAQFTTNCAGAIRFWLNNLNGTLAKGSRTIAKDPEVRTAILRTLSGKMFNELRREGRAAATLASRSWNLGTCLSQAGKVAKWGNALAFIAIEFLTTSNAGAASDPNFLLEKDPSLLFTEAHRGNACGYLTNNLRLREKFALMVDVMGKADQKLAEREEIRCGGEEELREYRNTELVAAGGYRKAMPEDFGKGVVPGAEQVRVALAQGTGVLPAR